MDAIRKFQSVAGTGNPVYITDVTYPTELANILGSALNSFGRTTYILSGFEPTSGGYTPGVVWYNGQVYAFEGDLVPANQYLFAGSRQTDERITIDGIQYFAYQEFFLFTGGSNTSPNGSLVEASPLSDSVIDRLKRIDIPDGSISAQKLAFGASSTNIGQLGGSLQGTLPNPTIRPGAVNSGMLAPGTIPTSFPPSGLASGVLSGNYPSPSLAYGALAPGSAYPTYMAESKFVPAYGRLIVSFSGTTVNVSFQSYNSQITLASYGAQIVDGSTPNSASAEIHGILMSIAGSAAKTTYPISVQPPTNSLLDNAAINVAIGKASTQFQIFFSGVDLSQTYEFPSIFLVEYQGSVNPPEPGIVSGTINPPSQTVDSSASISTMTHSGYSGAITSRQWQVSNDSFSWSDIAGATSTSYTQSPISNTGSTDIVRYYRIRINNSDTYSDRSILIVRSQSAPSFNVGYISPASQQITSGTASVSLSHAGYAGITSRQWQSSTNGTNWTNISGATGEFYSPGNLTGSDGTTYYYRIQINGISQYSSVASILIQSGGGGGSVISSVIYQGQSVNPDRFTYSGWNNGNPQTVTINGSGLSTSNVVWTDNPTSSFPRWRDFSDSTLMTVVSSSTTQLVIRGGSELGPNGAVEIGIKIGTPT